jgi:hypothetical protein
MRVRPATRPGRDTLTLVLYKTKVVASVNSKEQAKVTAFPEET